MNATCNIKKINKQNSIYVTPNFFSKLSGQSSTSIKVRIFRKSIPAVYFTKKEALNLGLPWGVGFTKQGRRPFISLDDPSIPDSVREFFYKQQLAERRAKHATINPPMLSAPAGSPAPKAPQPEISPALDAALDEKQIDQNFIDLFDCKSYQREHAKAWLEIVYAVKYMSTAEKKIFIKGTGFSYSTLRRKLKAYNRKGIPGLYPKWGKAEGRTTVKDEWQKYFEAIYCNQNQLSAAYCRTLTLGHFRDTTEDISKFPSFDCFLRRLRREVSKGLIYYAREGEHKWNAKYGYYLEGDDSAMFAGERYVGDHYLFDVQVYDPVTKKINRPWLSAWCDQVSNKFVGWSIHIEPPSSIHVLASLTMAIKECGVPAEILTDNGKDYIRVVGKRKKTNRDQEIKTMLAFAGIDSKLARIKNAQAKIIERGFRDVAAHCAKLCIAYTGSNTDSRPEKLKTEIKRGELLTIDEFRVLVSQYIREVHNRQPSKGKLKGKCPDQLWEERRKPPVWLSSAALELLSMQPTRMATIGRNGVRDSEFNQIYWAEWMIHRKGEEVYLLRNPKDARFAYVFTADGKIIKDSKAEMQGKIAHRAKGVPLTFELLKGMLREQAKEKKIHKQYHDNQYKPKSEELLKDAIQGTAALNELAGYVPQTNAPETVVDLPATELDRVAVAAKRINQDTVKPATKSEQEDDWRTKRWKEHQAEMRAAEAAEKAEERIKNKAVAQNQ
ncbi:MAG: transposase family protein [Pseudomonadota bacterium]